MINKLQLDDFELSYTSEGEGRDVLFLHGFPSNMFFWDDIKYDLKDKKICTYCGTGYRGNIAADELIKGGFNAVTLEGGYSAWM